MSSELQYNNRASAGLSNFYVLLFQQGFVANGGGLTSIVSWTNTTIRNNVIELVDTNHAGIYLADITEGVPAGRYTPVVFQSSGTPSATATTTDTFIGAMLPIDWTGEALAASPPPTVNEIVTALAGAVPIQIISPVAPQHLDLFKGDKYDGADGTGRTISFTFQAGEPWPDTISSATFTCKPTPETLDNYPNAASLSSVACTVDVATGSGRQVTVTLTATQLATLQASLTGTNNYRFWVIANGSSNACTLRAGTMTVRPDPTSV